MLQKKTLFLFLFVVTCFLNMVAIKYNGINYNLFLRFLRIVFLFLFYFYAVKKHSFVYVGILFFFLISSLFFSFKSNSLLGIIALAATRLGLIHVAISKSKEQKINWVLLSKISLLFFMLGGIILYLYYNNSLFFYCSAFATILLIFLGSMTFANLLDTRKYGNLEFFIAVGLFIISDTIFGVQKITYISINFLVIASFLYNLGYFLITKSFITKEQDLRLENGY